MIFRRLPFWLLAFLPLALAADPIPVQLTAPTEPSPLPFAVGGRSPEGHVLGANSRYLTLDGKPWFPIMGEFHYSRYPAAEWERELLKMKAGGITIVSTYVFWIHHEEVQGQFDWSGQRDLRRFVELCRKHGLYFWLRIGPWAHGEVRNGGLPDWVVQQGNVRRNDPGYLASVQRFYREIAAQVKGEFWQDGGPIIGLQIENEYRSTGPGQGTEHMLELKRLANEAGLSAPFYTATAWDNAVVPPGFLPVFGGYADGFWQRETYELPPSSHYFFGNSRFDETLGETPTPERTRNEDAMAKFPYLTAEMGGGMAQSYHRRPLITGDDTAAMGIVKLGMGVTLYGYYMYHGGTNPDGKLTTLQETQATPITNWNDVTVKAYDFQAPLGEFGQVNPAYRTTRPLHQFLAEFGSQIAPMTTNFPSVAPKNLRDTTTPRFAVRSDGQRGFITINNHQRSYPLPVQKGFQARLTLANGATLDVPRQPVDLPTGVYMIWPVNLDLAGANLAYATVQPLCRLKDPATQVFLAWNGVRPELAFDDAKGLEISAPEGARVRHIDGKAIVDKLEPSTRCMIHVSTPKGRSVDLLVLPMETARDVWKINLGGVERLLFSRASVFTENGNLHLYSRDPSALQPGFYPGFGRKKAGFKRFTYDGIFVRYAKDVPMFDVKLDWKKPREAAPTQPVAMGARKVAAPPPESVWDKTSIWHFKFSGNAVGDTRLFLRVNYEGDAARIYAGSRLVTDNYYYGAPWEIGLWTLTPEELANGVEMRVLPLREDAPIHLSKAANPKFRTNNESVWLNDVQLSVEHEVTMQLGR